MALLGFERKGIVLGGAIALALLILPVIIITTREAVRAVPERDPARLAGAGRHRVADHLAADAALGRPRHRDRHDPRPVPGDRRGGAAAAARPRPARPLRPDGLLSPITALPIQIYALTSQSQEEFQQAASAAIIVLLVMILGLNALAIFIRNKFQRAW